MYIYMYRVSHATHFEMLVLYSCATCFEYTKYISYAVMLLVVSKISIVLII